ncbi:MAG: hypothetical protein HY726_13680 [Candidatus Rokubacteria bacterium]|nr:hypothetical protein [Candidatus Rokubacteria bacterium]
MKRIFAMLLAGFALVALVATAQSKEPIDVTGVWKGTMVTLPGANAMGVVVLNLKQEGTKVTGTVSLEEGSFSFSSTKTSPAASPLIATEKRIENGRVTGDILTFELRGGSQTMNCQFLVRARSMQGTIELLQAQASVVSLERE